MNELLESDIEIIAAALRDGAISARVLTEAALQRVEALDSRLHAFFTLSATPRLNAPNVSTPRARPALHLAAARHTVGA